MQLLRPKSTLNKLDMQASHHLSILIPVKIEIVFVKDTVEDKSQGKVKCSKIEGCGGGDSFLLWRFREIDTLLETGVRPQTSELGYML
jgi:hypothetical protein